MRPSHTLLLCLFILLPLVRSLPATAAVSPTSVLATEMVEHGEATAQAARRLNPLSLKNLQIRNALAEFNRWAREFATAATLDAPAGELARGLCSVAMWATTVDYHLDRSTATEVKRRWQEARRRWQALENLYPANGTPVAFIAYRHAWEELEPDLESQDSSVRDSAWLRWQHFLRRF